MCNKSWIMQSIIDSGSSAFLFFHMILFFFMGTGISVPYFLQHSNNTLPAWNDCYREIPWPVPTMDWSFCPHGLLVSPFLFMYWWLIHFSVWTMTNTFVCIGYWLIYFSSWTVCRSIYPHGQLTDCLHSLLTHSFVFLAGCCVVHLFSWTIDRSICAHVPLICFLSLHTVVHLFVFSCYLVIHLPFWVSECSIFWPHGLLSDPFVLMDYVVIHLSSWDSEWLFNLSSWTIEWSIFLSSFWLIDLSSWVF